MTFSRRPNEGPSADLVRQQRKERSEGLAADLGEGSRASRPIGIHDDPALEKTVTEQELSAAQKWWRRKQLAERGKNCLIVSLCVWVVALGVSQARLVYHVNKLQDRLFNAVDESAGASLERDLSQSEQIVGLQEAVLELMEEKDEVAR